MGFRVHLIAIRGKEVATIHRELRVTGTGNHEEIAESPVVGASLPNGAYLLYINDGDAPVDETLRRLSQKGSLITCDVNETVMASSASEWRDGTQLWSVNHDSQQGISDLKTEGSPPPELQPIRDRLLAAQAEDDEVDFIFDIPVELFVALGGVRYDQDIPGAGPQPWEILKRLA